MEEWKAIEQAPNYAVSNFGNIKRAERGRRTRPGLPRSQWEVRGYKYITLHIDGKNRGFQVHRLVAAAFIGKSDLQVNHINGNKSDNRVQNLEYVTGKQNQQHSKNILKTFQMGERHHKAKLTEKDIVRIFTLHFAGASLSELGKIFNCTAVNIGYILHRKAWAHVPIEPTLIPYKKPL
jgi:hypothetical protein